MTRRTAPTSDGAERYATRHDRYPTPGVTDAAWCLTIGATIVYLVAVGVLTAWALGAAL